MTELVFFSKTPIPKHILPYNISLVSVDFQNFKMLPQRNGLSPFKTLSVLVFLLLLTHFCRGNLHTNVLSGSQLGLESNIITKSYQHLTLNERLKTAVEGV